MTTTSPYDILFTPIKIGPVTAPNRFFASPHSTGHGWTEPTGAIALRSRGIAKRSIARTHHCAGADPRFL